MKQIFKVDKCSRIFYFAANLTPSILSLEKQFNCYVDFTGLKADSFGLSYINKQGFEVYDLTGIRKELKAMN